MARYTGAVCRICRREAQKLMLKGERCYSDKCAFDRRGYPPGEHGQRHSKLSDYALQLREKQKVRKTYGIMEKQFHHYFEVADSRKGVTGENLLQLLERRLDNVVYRLGFAESRNQARQLVRHSHFRVNGKKVNIPSYLMGPSDVIAVHDKSRKLKVINAALENAERRVVPPWLELDKANYKGLVKVMPSRSDITAPIQEQLIVELYSK